MRKRKFAGWVLGMLLAGHATAAADSWTVAIVSDGAHRSESPMRDMFIREILDLAGGEFDVTFPDEKYITADWTTSGVNEALDTALNDPDIDLVLALGVIASHEASRRGPLPKPVIAPIVIDPELQGLPVKDGTSGVHNLNYLTFPSTIVRDVKTFRAMIDFDRMALIASAPLLEAIPEMKKHFGDRIRSLGVELTLVPVEDTAREALDALPSNVEAAYLAPLHQLGAGEWDALVKGLTDRGIPSFSLFGRETVESGILATLRPDVFSTLTRRVALNVQSVMLGEDPGGLPTSFSVGERLVINMATVRATGAYPDWGYLTEAELIDEAREDVAREITLESAVRDAWDANLDLRVARGVVAAGKAAVGQSRARLLPEIGLSALGLVIDDDRASPLGQAERTVSGSATLRQSLYGDDAWTGYGVEKQLQTTRIAQYDAARLDIAHESSTAYLSVLRALTFENIQRQNLTRSRRNLELARIRESVGFSGPGEVYRWESEIALSRKATIDANAQRNLAEMAVNRILDRPLEESFRVQEADLENPWREITGAEDLVRFFRNKRSFRLLRTFIVEEGLARSPELRALNALIEANERVLANARRSFWLPDVGLEGQITRRFSESGEGSEAADFGDFPLSVPDETDWSVGLQASLPLFAGGGRFSDVDESREELIRLRAERGATADRIEQRIRSALHLAGASLAGIRQARESAEAAYRNLDLVIDGYTQGAVSVIDLIDAQNTALVAEEGAADAVYDYLIDMMEVQRAAGVFHFMLPQSEREEARKRLEEYMAEAEG